MGSLNQLDSKTMKSIIILESGDLLDGRFRLLEEIGAGGMGRVFRALDLDTKQIVAIKTLRTLYASRASHRARFTREVKVLGRLHHRNTVKILHTQMDAEIPFYVMEFLDGAPLGKVIADAGPMAPERALDITEQILQSLIEAHAQGVIHRDLKPDNIVLLKSNEGQDLVKVIDFGIAKRTAPREQQSVLTSDGVFLGSLLYITPEALMGAPVTPATDLYAVGHILYTMLMGRPAYGGLPHDKVVLHKVYDKGELEVPTVDGPSGAVIIRACRRDPKRRYGTAKQMLGHVRFIQKNFAAEPRAQRTQRPLRTRGKATPPGMVRLDTTQIKRWRERHADGETRRLTEGKVKG